MRGSVAPVGRDHRPEWVSCRPMTSPSSFACAATCASTSSARSAAEVGDRRRVDHELPRVGAPVVGHRDRFTAPHELRSALAEAAPPPAHQVGGRTVVVAVPALHGQHREPVADRSGAGGTVGVREGFGERPVGRDGVVDAELLADAEHVQPVAQLSDRSEPLHLHDVGAHSIASSRAAMSARTGRSVSGRRGAP